MAPRLNIDVHVLQNVKGTKGQGDQEPKGQGPGPRRPADQGN